jgi:hypothetical protein
MDTQYTASKPVVDKLWEIIGNVDKQSSYWTAEQLKWLAHEIEPPDYWPRNRPTNEVINERL